MLGLAILKRPGCREDESWWGRGASVREVDNQLAGRPGLHI